MFENKFVKAYPVFQKIFFIYLSTICIYVPSDTYVIVTTVCSKLPENTGLFDNIVAMGYKSNMEGMGEGRGIVVLVLLLKITLASNFNNQCVHIPLRRK